jgi:hypothetical protein
MVYAVIQQQSLLFPTNVTTATCRYLSDVEPDAGGETALPLADALDPEWQSTESMSDCANRMGIAVRPRKVRHQVYLAMIMWVWLSPYSTHEHHASCQVVLYLHLLQLAHSNEATEGMCTARPRHV